MEKTTFARTNLFGVRVIMVIMHVPVGELLCQAVTGWIPVLKCPLAGACGLLWLCPIMPDIKCHRFPRIRLQWRLPGTGEPPGMATGVRGLCQVGA
jgi:hypothetical protein